MGRNAGPVRGQPFGLVAVLLRIRGAGAAAPLIEMGPNGEISPGSATSGMTGVTSSRAAAGDYTLTFKEKPGKFVCWSPGFGASTPAAVATYRFQQIEEDAAFATTTETIRMFNTTPATEAAAQVASDLAATDVVYVVLWFRTANINPT